MVRSPLPQARLAAKVTLSVSSWPGLRHLFPSPQLWARGRELVAFRDYRYRISKSAYLPDERLSAQCIKQRLGIFQIGRVKTFCEPVVNLGEHVPCFIAPALFL